MIKSALSLETKIDNKYLTNVDKFNNDFSVEALANAGQRLGMKGDSVKYSEFTLKELLTNANKDYIAKSNINYNCVIKYLRATQDSQSNALLCLVESGKEFDENKIHSYVSLIDDTNNESINLFDDNYISREFRFDKPINNIEYFVENSFLTVSDNIFKTFLFGKKLGYKDSDEFNIEILYNEFDLSSNTLLRAVRMYHLFSLANSNYYATIDIQKTYDNKDGDFILKVFILNDRTISISEDQIDVTELKNSFCLKHLREQIATAKNNKEIDGFKQLYNKFINVDDNESYLNFINEDSSLYKIISNYDILNTNTQSVKKIEDIMNYDVVTHAILKQTDVLDASIIGENLAELSNKIAAYLSLNGVEDDINNAIGNIYKDTSYYAAIIKNNQASDLSTNLKYNSEKNVITSMSSGYLKDEVKNLLDSDYIGIDKRIEYINNDILYLFPRLLQKYNEDKFGNRSKIIKNILFKLYEKVYLNSKVDDYGVLYIPLDTAFNYVANRNNELEIFYSNDIFVQMTDLDNLVQIKKVDALVDKILYSYKGEDKSKVFSFSLEYNNMYDGIINNIFIMYKYTLPFINGANNWSVNDIDTNISATVVGVDKQNLVILNCSYNKDEKTFTNKLLNVFDDSIFNTAGWMTKTVEYNDINLRYSVPRINSTNINSLIGSTILLICDSSCVISNYEVDDTVSYSFFLTVKKDDIYNEFSFSPIELENKSLLNLSSVINKAELIENVTKQIQLSSRLFNAIILNNRASILNHTTTNIINNSLLLTINTKEDIVKCVNNIIKRLNDDTDSALNGFQYLNNLNVSLGFISSRTNNITDYIVDSIDRNYYLKSLSNISVTNITYPYISNLEERVIKETIKIVDLESNFIRFETVTIKKLVRDNIYDMYSSHGVFIQRLTETEYLKVVNKEYTLKEIELSSSTIKDIPENELPNISFAKEYLFNSDVPLLNVKELFIANSNVMNRVNIISLDKDGNIYNGYIGTNFESDDKTELLITSSEININIGNNTLLSSQNSQNFKKYKSAKIKFDDSINLDSKKITAESQIFSGSVINGVTVYNANVNVIGTFIQTNIDSISKTVVEFLSPTKFYNKYNIELSGIDDHGIINIYDPEWYNIFSSDFIDNSQNTNSSIYYPLVDLNDINWNKQIGEHEDYQVILINWINLLKQYGIQTTDYNISVNNDCLKINYLDYYNMDKSEFNSLVFNRNCVHLIHQAGGTEIINHCALTGIYSTYYDPVFKEMSVVSNNPNTICVMKNIFVSYYVYENTCYVDITIPNNILAKLSGIKLQ